MSKNAANKTQATKRSVAGFIDAISDEQQRNDAKALAKMLASITKAKPEMWGTSIVGFGKQHYKYASGREGDWFTAGFSPRKDAITLYLMGGFERHIDLLEQLGKVKTGKSCLYIKRLADVDQKALKDLIARTAKPASRFSG